MMIFQKLSKHTLLFTSIFFISFLALAIVLFYDHGLRTTIVLATTHQPERFTELYFEGHTGLPRGTQTDKLYSFTFTIHNLEYKKMDYPYLVYLEDSNGQKTVLASGNVTMIHDSYRSFPVIFALPDTITRGKVVVKLTQKKQEIHFWMGNLP